MARFFNFYDPLEKRYVFNSFLVVVALVEILILVFTLIWQIDFEGIFATQPRPPVPFPWQAYLMASFIAPIALLFLFGLIIQGFEVFGQAPEASPGATGRGSRFWRVRYLLGLLVFMAVVAFLVQGRAAFALIVAGIKALGLGGSYLLIALLALSLLYLWVRLILRYRLQKKALEYQYLLTLAERHGVIVIDPKAHPELAAELAAKKKLPAAAPILLDSPDSQPDPDPE
jgi:hypothetical protein